MKPYYEHGSIQIYHGDSREVAGELPTVDVIIADPPYGDTSLSWDKKVSHWSPVMDAWLNPCGSMWVFGSFRYFFENAGDFSDWSLAQDVIWEKHNGSSFHADRFKRVHEHAVQFYRGPWKSIFKAPVTTPDATARAVRRKQRPPHTGHIDAGLYVSEDGGPRLARSVLYVRSCHGEAHHPTQKPVGIIDPLLRYSCKVGGIVGDPYMGSGSVLVAAAKLNLPAIGIEIDEKFCEVAANRLSQEVLQFAWPLSEIPQFSDADAQA